MRRIHDHYKNKGLRVDGMLTSEVRKGDERIGFKITDLSSGAEGWLARMGDTVGPRIGKYSVDSEDLEEIGVGALKRAAERSADRPSSHCGDQDRGGSARPASIAWR